MLPLIVSSLAVMLAWTFAARRLARWHISGPLVMVAGGVVAGLIVGDGFASKLDTHIAERVVELVLAVLLFVDATVVRDGFLAGERGAVLRLLCVALPLMVAAAFVVGVPLLPTPSWAVVFVIACVVMPLDFASAPHLLKDRDLPLWVRHVLAIESGYNDGLFSPAFAFGILVIGESGHGGAPTTALRQAFPAAAYAVLVGVGFGAVTGLALRQAERVRWSSSESVGIAALLLPIVTYSIAVAVGGNGFVAAFLAGIAYKLGRAGLRRSDDADVTDTDTGTGNSSGTGTGTTNTTTGISEHEFATVEALGTVASLIVWFVFGAVAVLVCRTGVPGSVILYGVLVLTVVRMVPVYLAMLGTSASWLDRTLLGLVGPRGTTSIVFGLLAFNAIRDEDADLALSTMTIVLVGSLVLHGVAVPVAAQRLRKSTVSSPDGDEPAPA
ncbi:cation:proton antiporter [Catenulispora sp. NF23]|uniref:Cation:proton antiporter n=1 Tax=Catenulispora pinistramenti TaxID=2705254 RepID=A0ABS5KPX1_9ACTN|nr:cation:proton antiporter [Catenulispora pinistramenti]MBS2535286.1 cation:proton antiporter [Catenulispora pinistramenti]MBS2548089.1 cation:proton antiporter [Catenulispora pinistramenti]